MLSLPSVLSCNTNTVHMSPLLHLLLNTNSTLTKHDSLNLVLLNGASM